MGAQPEFVWKEPGELALDALKLARLSPKMSFKEAAHNVVSSSDHMDRIEIEKTVLSLMFERVRDKKKAAELRKPIVFRIPRRGGHELACKED